MCALRVYLTRTTMINNGLLLLSDGVPVPVLSSSVLSASPCPRVRAPNETILFVVRNEWFFIRVPFPRRRFLSARKTSIHECAVCDTRPDNTDRRRRLENARNPDESEPSVTYLSVTDVSRNDPRDESNEGKSHSLTVHRTTSTWLRITIFSEIFPRSRFPLGLLTEKSTLRLVVFWFSTILFLFLRVFPKSTTSFCEK